ncbi:MAG: hypothetical protein A2937_03465 [Candidatus Yonathbacteria bacterium RIFCSPLOWO2_01_FULL_47_33b]|uniref:Uncharacterized protein n=1 Tax=Candidatus Yonathbacteria bacterium RIFCSPLOWO2_01_FULL_47_33b TaxID=1802727 RepID=A0A1G2SI05_9BACT|nr:MAG: hypothetical protein A2937_03465 [Candidatus Yonathbacteria bacterium RIFCSPLOWO2_01_FULL_47_33b]
MFKIFALMLLSAVFFIFTGIAMMLHFFGTSEAFRLDAFFIFGPFLGGCATAYSAFQEIICWHKKYDAKNRILRKLDPNAGYLVRGRMSVVGDVIMSVVDITTKELFLVELATYYPPTGFTVEKTRMSRDVLVPIGKKLLIGSNCELAIVSSD